MSRSTVGGSYWVETLGCPKNAVDSDKIAAALEGDGLRPAGAPGDADLVVVNTCAFIEAARRESIDVTLALADARRPGARLVVTGCLAERYGARLAAALPEADAVVGFAGAGTISEVVLRRPPRGGPRDLLELPRPQRRPDGSPSSWAYLKVAEGCDRVCAFCAIPSFRGKQRSRTPDAVVAEARQLLAGGTREIVLVAQDIASYGRDAGSPERGADGPAGLAGDAGRADLAGLLRRLDTLAADGLCRLRLLYLYPSQVRDPLVATMLELGSVVPYFDLSLQHASEPLLRRMRRPGGRARFTAMIDDIRRREPDAAFRSSFIVGFPGETEDDHAELCGFLDDVGLDWAGFFPWSPEEGTPAAGFDGVVAPEHVAERLRECSGIQDRVTRAARDALVGTPAVVLVDRAGLRASSADDANDAEGGWAVGRTQREAPEIDGVVRLDPSGAGAGAAAGVRVGSLVPVEITGAAGPDLVAVPRGGAS